VFEPHTGVVIQKYVNSLVCLIGCSKKLEIPYVFERETNGIIKKVLKFRRLRDEIKKKRKSSSF